MTKKRGRGRPKTANIRVSVMIEPDLHAKLRERAKAENRLFSNMLNVVIREILTNGVDGVSIKRE